MQKQIIQRMGFGLAMLALFGVIWAATGTLGLATPGLAMAGCLLGSGGLLFYRCMQREYICLTGAVKEVSTSGLRKKPKFLLIEDRKSVV